MLANYPAITFARIDFVRWAKGNYLTTTLAEIRLDTEFNVAENRLLTQSAAKPTKRYWQTLAHRGS